MNDSENDKKIKIEFAPGCFNDFEGTQEELDELVAEIQRMADSGELFENATELTDIDPDDLDDDVRCVVEKVIDPKNRKKRLH